MGYFKHSEKKAKGEICLFNLIINLATAKKNLTGCTYNS